MIIRESEKLPNVGLPGTDMEGKHLMQHPFDDMEFGAYYVILEAGKELTLKGPTHKTPVEEIKYSHGYYCLEGIITATSVTNTNSTLGPYVINKDSFHMFPSSVSLTCNVEKKAAVIVIYVPEDEEKPPLNVISANRADLLNSKRCVDWGKGKSVRFLLAEDGYPISVTHCSYDNKETARLEYDEYLKTNIFINGSVDVKYGSVGLEKSCQLTCSPKSACVVSANENDRHSLTTQNDCQSINVFSPALKGPEKHTWESPDDYSDFS
ncbi:uncharacterized protein LOC142338220 [Convolutriloba macropyga]|uniref:uncharacterized protein LOC142338220 n=1 Tax=Convolutriloba macropyga TaxID=536237 RepID=UPI003F51C358